MKTIDLNKPNVVGVIACLEGLKKVPTLGPADADILEIRLDAFPQNLAVVHEALQKAQLPLILTVREKIENEVVSLNVHERICLFRLFLPYASFIDLELKEINDFRETYSLAKLRKVGIIGSVHDFNGCPPFGDICDLCALAEMTGVDVFKIAVTAEPQQIRQFLLLQHHFGNLKFSIMSMGEYGRISRLLFARTGSCLNYGYIVKPNVKGQWPAAVLKERIQELFEV